jgi:hypothetical protein
MPLTAEDIAEIKGLLPADRDEEVPIVSSAIHELVEEVERLRAKDADVSLACAPILDAKPAEIAALYRAAWDINSAAWGADDELRRARAEVERLRAENAALRQRQSPYPADACQYCGAPIVRRGTTTETFHRLGCAHPS